MQTNKRLWPATGVFRLSPPPAVFFTSVTGLTLGAGVTLPAWAVLPGTNLIQAGATQVIPGGGTLGLNCNHLNVQGNLLVGPGTVKQANDVGITGVLNGGSGVLDVGGNWTNYGTFVAGSSTVNLTQECTSGPVVVTGNTTFCNLNLSGNGANYIFPAGNATTVNCAINLGKGNTLTTSKPGETAYIELGPGATVTGEASKIQVVIVPYAPPPPPPTPNAIPTLGEYGLIVMVLLLAAIGARHATFVSTTTRSPGRG